MSFQEEKEFNRTHCACAEKKAIEGTSAKVAVYKSGRETSAETEFSSSWSWTSSLQSCGKINARCVSPLACGSSFWRAGQTNTESRPKNDSASSVPLSMPGALGVQGCRFPSG